jgi:hypothetical protein
MPPKLSFLTVIPFCVIKLDTSSEQLFDEDVENIF